ncbi:serine/threonine kinase [Fragilaria crotonensis]|nr:serine/threonine kinase [Fragilaria crotonensis]
MTWTLDYELMYNARDGNLDEVRDLLRRGANVNAKGKYGWTALIVASWNDHLEVVRALLDHDGVDVNIQGIKGWTALSGASYKGQLEVVRALLMHNGVDANIQNEDGETALDVARKENKGDVARLLQEHMEREKLRKEEERKRREEEERKRREEEAQARLKEAERLIVEAQARLKEEVERLNVEAQARLKEKAERLNALEKEFVKRYEEEERKRREEEEKAKRRIEESQARLKDALEKELEKRRDDAARLKALEEKHINRERRNNIGWTQTALICFCAWGCWMVVRALLNHQGVNVPITDNHGAASRDWDISARPLVEHVEPDRLHKKEEQTSFKEEERDLSVDLVRKARDGNLDKVRDLLKSGANVNAKDEYGYTALIRASMFGHLEVVRFLLVHDGVDVNTKNDFGVAALIAASKKGRLEVVRALLKHDGVDVNIKNDHGATALIIAIEKGHVEVVRAILNHAGVDVNTKNNNGDAALLLASLSGRVELVHALMNHRRVDVNVKNNHGATALTLASEMGHVEVVRALLNHVRVDVNIKNTNHGDTALILASWKGHLEVARALLKHHGVDVNIQNNNGNTALTLASYDGHVEVVRALLEHDGVDMNIKNNHGATALDCARRQKKEDVALLLELHIKRDRRKKIGWTWMALACASIWGSLNAFSSFKIEQFRRKLHHVMNTTSAEPVELSLAYVERCIKKDHKLGSGAFGDVFLAEDSRLPKKFAVKMIRPTKCDDANIKEIRRTFRTELSTLKKCRHPNIIVLYGYSLNANRAQQCLVYEYAANGSLAGFFTDVGNRARLSSDIRLSIMFQLVRAVHFLHTGGCKKVTGDGWKVFHRDIKSANICLADDFTPRLIDCGLAKCVPDDNYSATPGSLTVSYWSKPDGPPSGTSGYVCPEYLWKKGPYKAAYDVYSIGVVMVELILGRLNRGQSMPSNTEFHDVFQTYVQDEDHLRIDDGWGKLKRDADPTIIWNAASLELVCKAAIKCMHPSSKKRLSTKELLDELRDAIRLNTNAGVQNSEAVTAIDSGSFCDVCNNYRTDITCSEGHALCPPCIVDKLADDSGCQLLCLIKECSSKIHDKDLCQHIPTETYNRYVEKRVERKTWDDYFLQFESRFVGFQSHLFGQVAGLQSQVSGLKFDLDGIKDDVKVGFDENRAQLQKQLRVLMGLKKGLDRSLAALAHLSADQFKECPNLVWMTPVVVDKTILEHPKKWFTKKYSVVFICARSGEPGHEPFEIDMPREWIVKIAPWLKLCLKVIKVIAKSQALPFPDPDLPFFEQCETMNAFLDSVLQEASHAVVTHCEACEALLENDTMSIDTYGQVQTLAGGAFKFRAEKARKEKRSQWMPPQMVPVLDENGTPIWVKGEYAKFYTVRVNHEDDTTRT